MQNTNTLSIFETGATSHQANNLILSVMNDGEVYKDRLHCGFALLRGSNHRVSFLEITRSEAAKQRLCGSKFTASHIKEASGIIQALTLEECKESYLNDWNCQSIIVQGRKWFDKVNGNTYFSCWVQVPTEQGFKSFCIPFQYGYGDQWQFESVVVLRKLRFFKDDNRQRWELPIVFSDSGYMLKRDMFQGLYI